MLDFQRSCKLQAICACASRGVGVLDAHTMSGKTKPSTDRKVASTKPHAKPTKPLPDLGTAPPRTLTVPEHLRGPWTQGPESVVALAVDGDDRLYDLPRVQPAVTIGSHSDQDIVLSSPWISRKHCVIERQGPRTVVRDVGSRNGIVVGDSLQKEFDLKPAGRFKLGGQVLVAALNESMRSELPVVGQLVCRESERRESGSQERPSRLDVLAIALDRAPVMITGEAGLDHDRLARAIHAMSPRRVFDLVTATLIPDDRKSQRALIDAAARSSLILSITDQTAPLDRAFAAMLFDRSYNIRVIALAPTIAKATDVLGEDGASRMTKIALRPIAFRPTVTLWLFDELLRERASTLRTADLTAPNRHALEAWGWPENFPELRQVADWLVILDKLSIRDAAEQLGIARTTLHDQLSLRGLSLPLTRHGRGLQDR